MPHTFDITPDADIYQYPEKIQTLGSKLNLELTLGDLHGNAMKLVYFLVTSGVMETAEDDYDLLAEIYQKNYLHLTDDDLIRFKDILHKSQTRFNAGASLRFIGDVLADRGNNDYFTLLVLQRLHLANIPYEIIFSNHDGWFIECYEANKSFFINRNPEQAQSACHLHFILQDDLTSEELLLEPSFYNKLSITRADILEIIKTAYKPHLKALSYTLTHDKKEIMIYSHAPIGLETIKAFSKELLGKGKYEDKSAKKLGMTIDKLNTAFSQRVASNTITQAAQKQAALYSYDKINEFSDWLQQNANSKTLRQLTSPFIFPNLIILAWNKLIDILDRPKKHTTGKHYSYQFVHGHHRYVIPNEESHIINLDNENLLGGPNIKTDTYRALISVKHIKYIPLLNIIKPLQRTISEKPPTPPSDAVSILTHLKTPSEIALLQNIASELDETLEPEEKLVVSHTDNTLSIDKASSFFPIKDISVGLKALKADILSREWITNMGGETIVGANTKIPQSIAHLYTVINNALLDKNSQPLNQVNWLATRNSVIKILEKAVQADHFSRDPKTQIWLQTVYKASQTAITEEQDLVNDKKTHDLIQDPKVADIFNIIRKTEETGGQSIQVKTDEGMVISKKVPRTFEKMYSVIRNAQKDKNSNDVVEVAGEATQQKIFEIAKSSAENRTFFRKDTTQKAIVLIANNLLSQHALRNLHTVLTRIKYELIQARENKEVFGYTTGFFTKTIEYNLYTTVISWKESAIFDLIQQSETGLLPLLSAAEQINKIISDSKQNLAFLNDSNDDLTSFINSPDILGNHLQPL